MEDEDRYTRITLRIPKDLHARLAEAADATSKSLNAEIIGRLQGSFQSSTSVLFGRLPDVELVVREERAPYGLDDGGIPVLTPEQQSEVRMRAHLRRQASLRDQLTAKLASIQAKVAQLHYLLYSGPADGLTGDEMVRLRAELDEANADAQEVRDQLDTVIRAIDKTGAW